MTETPKEAARRLAAGAIHDGFEPESLHEYRDGSGNTLYWRMRLKNPQTGAKWIRPFYLNGNGYELGEPKLSSKRPLYGLSRLLQNPDSDVWVVEGETKVDALNKYGLVAVTSGSATSAAGSDWTPMRGHKVNGWADNDTPGREYIGEVAAIALELGCSVLAVDIDGLGLPEGGDVVDWLLAHPQANASDIDALPRLTPSTRADSGRKRTVAQVLIDIGTRCDLFHDERGDGYALTTDSDIRRTLRLRGGYFRRWLCKSYYDQTGKAAYGTAIASALDVLEAKAVFDGRAITLFNRFAEWAGAVFVDLCDDQWRAIKVTATGWEVLDKPPILFRRYAHQHALPEPQRGGDLTLLKSFLNLRDEADQYLVEAWLATAPFQDAPRPILAPHGPQGSAKSTFSRVLKSLLDPSAIDTVDLGRDPSALAQVLDHNAIPNFDNLSSIPRWAADMLCKAVTGGAFSKRELYTDAEDVILAFKRAPLVNGINIPTHAPDLLDRMLLIELERIPPDKSRDEREFWSKFNAARPGLFGAVLDAIAGVLRYRDHVQLTRLPRMADFARLACAYATYSGLGPKKMMDTIMANAGRQTQEVIESDPLATAVRDLIETRRCWEGTATELLAVLNEPYSHTKGLPEGWPKSAKSLGRRLKILHTTLAEVGIVTTWSSDGKSRRIEFSVKDAAQTSETSETAEPSFGAVSRPDVSSDQMSPNVGQTSERKPNSGARSDMTDVSDMKLQAASMVPFAVVEDFTI